MPTDATPEASPQTRRLYRMESSIEELNARIARLAIALGVSLKNENELARVMSPLQNQAAPQEFQSTPDRRLACKWTELRGLLVLRYGVEKSYVDQVGVTVTRELLVEAEAQMVREGFQPGADGIDLRRLFDQR
ncbi:MAG: hypothetical protein HHJ16_16550 [Polaromonas sp.]|uniref:hypothetical protein n=1 Tax=Polaromonas sp. TaxID=1869339 RepID=UPI0017C31D9F|nr:hypothetical protein [Polaromonas sp.]NMM11864.1 hypothetical protein [Polaromonas sp.]